MSVRSQWSSGDIQQLLDEGRCIQARMISRIAPSKNDVDEILDGTGEGSECPELSRDQSGGVLGLDDIIPQSQGLTTRDVLRDKHPPG